MELFGRLLLPIVFIVSLVIALSTALPKPRDGYLTEELYELDRMGELIDGGRTNRAGSRGIIHTDSYANRISFPPTKIEMEMRQVPQTHCLRFRKFDLIKRCRRYRVRRHR